MHCGGFRSILVNLKICKYSCDFGDQMGILIIFDIFGVF